MLADRRGDIEAGLQATPQELRDCVKQRATAYKYPHHVWLVDALPKGPTGKIVKREIAPGEPVMKTATSDQGEVAIRA